MLGLNKIKTLYTTTAYHYKYLGNKRDGKVNNTQNWEEIPTKFKCNYTTSQSIERLTNTFGTHFTSMTIETDSNINFKQNDKVVINGEQFQIKDIVVDNNPLSAYYTNKPQSYRKVLVLE